jgi:lysophospholipase L1-like esterase
MSVVVYADAGASTLADIQTVGGAAIAGSTLLVDPWSKIPLFLFPDNVDTVYAVVSGGPVVPLYARTDDRLDTLETTVAGLGGAAVLSVGTTPGTVAAGDDSRIIGAAQKASNLSDLASAGAARTNLGLGTAATTAAGDYDPAGAAASAQATAVQRANHTGTQSADTLTDGTTNKAFLATERTKLAGVAAGATANATDAQLRDRATHTGTQATSTVTGLDTALAALGAFGGNLAALFGDSLANNGDGVAYWIAALTNQKFCFTSVGGYINYHPGYTSSQIVALTTQITALSPRPRYCFISAGSNDAATGVTSATFLANITSICDALLAARILPVIMGPPPRTGVFGLVAEYNLRLYRYASSTGIPFLDQYSILVDPATGGYLAAYDSGDGTHPSPAGCKAIATKAATDLAPLASPALNLAGLAMSAGNVTPQAANLLDTDSNGVGDAYGVTPSSGFAYSRIADSRGWYWQRMTLSSAAGAKTVNGSNLVLPLLSTTLAASASIGAVTLSTVGTATVGGAMYKLSGPNGSYEIVRANSVSGSGPFTVTLSALTPLKMAHSAGDTLTPFAAIGDTLAFAVRVRSGQDQATLAPQFTMYTAAQASVTRNVIMTSPNTVYGFRRQLEDGLLYAEAVIPASTVSIQFSFTAGPENGTYDFALPYIANLSAIA